MSRQRFFVSVSGVVALLASSALAACGDDDAKPAATATRAVGSASAPAATPTRAAGQAATTTNGPIKLENATTTPSGLKYVDVVVGTGPSPRADQSVTVHYTGRLAANGQKFDSSVDRGQPATFALTGVIKGFAEGISTMKVGGKRTVYIPAALGYGAAGTPGGPIPPNADLVFDIELIAIR